MRKYALIVLVVLIGALMFVGCDDKAAMEKINQLSEENTELKANLHDAEAKIAELEAKIKELQPEGEATEEVKEGETEDTKEVAKEETKEEPKKETPAKTGGRKRIAK